MSKSDSEVKYLRLCVDPIHKILSTPQIAQRRAAWQPRQPRYVKGILAKYAKLVSSSSVGAVTDLDL